MEASSEALTAPECPWWCTEDHGDGWTRGGGILTRHCRRHVLGADDVDGRPAEIELDRFASVVDGRVLVEAPTVRLIALAALSIESAQSVVATLSRLAEMAGEPSRAVA